MTPPATLNRRLSQRAVVACVAPCYRPEPDEN